MRREIDDQDAAAGLHHADGLAQSRLWIIEVMKDLMENDGIKAVFGVAIGCAMVAAHHHFSSLAAFLITFFGWVTISDYFDNSGFLYKEIQKGRPGPFTSTVSAKGTKLTQQNVAYNTTLTFNPDGSLKDPKQQAGLEGLGKTLASVLTKLKA